MSTCHNQQMMYFLLPFTSLPLICLLETMEYMLTIFKKKSQQFDHVVKIGRTHLQDAVPFALAKSLEHTAVY